MSITPAPTYIIHASNRKPLHAGYINDFVLILPSGEAITALSHSFDLVLCLVSLINEVSDDVTEASKKPRNHVRYALDLHHTPTGALGSDSKDDSINAAMELAAFCPGRRFAVVERKAPGEPWREVFVCRFPS